MSVNRADSSSFRLQILIVWLAMMGVSSYNFQPFLVGGFVSQVGLSETQAGLIMAANMLGVCAALVVATLGLKKWPRNRLALIALLAMSLGNMASVFASDVEGFLVLRFVVGLGEGLAIAAAVSAVAGFANPDRMFALVMVGMSFYGMAGLLVLPGLLEAFGMSVIFIGIAILSLSTLTGHRSLGELEVSTDSGQLDSPVPMGPAVILLLLALLFLYVCANGIWTYYERIGAAMHISTVNIGYALSAGLGASLVGGVSVVVLGDRFGRLLPVFIGISTTGLGVVLLFIGAGFLPYLVSVMMLFGGTGFTVPYVMGQLTELDPGGRLSVLGFLTLSVGNFLGPTAASGIVKVATYQMLLLFGAGLVALALALAMAAFTLITRRSPGGPQKTYGANICGGKGNG